MSILPEFSSRRLTTVLFTGALGVGLVIGPSAGFVSRANATSAGQTKGYCGAKLAGGKQPAEGVTPVLFVHGFNSGPAMWTGGVIKTAKGDVNQGAPKIVGGDQTLVEKVSSLGTTSVLTFDYSGSSTAWVTDKSIGPKLAKTISCLNDTSKRKVAVVAHSMGGLATQWAAAAKDRGGGGVGGKMSSVITFGTPYRGSWLAECAAKSQHRPSGCGVADAVIAACAGGRKAPPGNPQFDPQRRWGLVPNSAECKQLPDTNLADTPAGQALGNRNNKINELPAWPTGKGAVKVYRLAGDLKLGLAKRILLPDASDMVVTVKSATAGAAAGDLKHLVATCSNRSRRGDATTCFHTLLHQNRHLTDIAVQVVKDSTTITPSKSSRQKVVDWNNRPYVLTCDYLVKKPVRVQVRAGKAMVQGGALGGYDRWEVGIQRVTKGTLPGVGNVTAVLFTCAPQPSNFFTQELRVYRSADGTEIGRIPSFGSKVGNQLPPEYDPQSIVVKDGRIAADLKFYSPGDVHGQPSLPRHLTWLWNGHEFVKRSEIGAQHKAVDLSRQRITVNGMGPVKIGMSRADVAKALGAPIATAGRGSCTDVAVPGGPQGLRFRFAEGRLVAIAVGPPASSVKTASGLHIGSARDEVSRTYGNEVSATSSDQLVFAPTAPQYKGRVIAFALNSDKVETFIAGEPHWATFLPCAD